mmetsp:Transcript_761/g.917  ORF Transcript_761/g.917 Transcript_761/m.917 type:complete len:109 (+) Transcript_761:364-690(+)
MLSNSESVERSSRVAAALVHKLVITSKGDLQDARPFLLYEAMKSFSNPDTGDFPVNGWSVNTYSSVQKPSDKTVHVELLALKKNILCRLLTIMEQILRIDADITKVTI